MEESEKRRERLKAMRMEAAQVGLNNAPEPSRLPPGGLSNPLIESESISTAPLENNARFNFYTDPMAALSGNKRRNDMSPQNIPPRTPYQGIAPGPLHQNQAMNSPHQRPFHAPATHFYQRNPMETSGPFGRPQGYPLQPWGGAGGNFHSSPPNFYRGSNFASPSFGYGDQGPPRSRMQGVGPFIRPQGNPVSPGAWGGSPRYDSNSHYRPTRHGGNQFTDSGRGRGRSWNSGSGSSGRRGGRHSHGNISAELRPDLFYHTEMVEDPWRQLSPVTWKGADLEEQDSKQSWLPESTTIKKGKLSPEVSNISIRQPSLAEYLAASFDDSTQ